MTLQVRLGGSENRWTVWCYPPAGDEPGAGDVMVAHALDAAGAAWHGNPLGVALIVLPGARGKLYVHVHDWNKLNGRGLITVEGRDYALSDHSGAGRWLAFDTASDETRDGRIDLSADPTAGPNLMISEVAFVPDK